MIIKVVTTTFDWVYGFQELHVVNGLMEKLRLENKQKLQDEREWQTLELDRRVAEVSQAFYNADSERMKIMKLKLSRETKRVKRIKWMLVRERSNRKKLELQLAKKKRKGQKMGKRNKKSRVCKVIFFSTQLPKLEFDKTKEIFLHS